MTDKHTDVSEIMERPYATLLVPEEDGSYRAEIMEFPGCLALGDTEAEALASIKRVMEAWLYASIEQGQPIPEPYEWTRKQ